MQSVAPTIKKKVQHAWVEQMAKTNDNDTF